MKYAIILTDGAADEPIPALDGKTVLEAAHLPHLDQIATEGIVGWSNNTPDNLPAGSDVATMTVLGYDPQTYYTGRAPLEAAAMGIALGPRDWAIRCNLVTVEKGKMVSFNAGQISSAEGAELLQAANDKLGSDAIRFYPGVSYRNLLVWRDLADMPAPLSRDTRTFPPHDYTDRSILSVSPAGPGSVEMVSLMGEVHQIFAEHPVNKKRIAEGKLPATDAWLWGQGLRPQLPPFTEKYGLSGVMITAVDLLRGLGAILGWKRIDVPGATGLYDTNYEGKASAAIDALQEVDVACIHIEGPDEAGHDGSMETKIYALEQIDRYIIGPLYEALKQHGAYRILITPDHPTPVRLKTHTHANVPWVMAGTGIVPDAHTSYCEKTAADSKTNFPEGFRMMRFFVDSTNH
ncbi:MAG: cofactor-independent phosphoglycerate mutase [Planctomycetia bacterium]|nr:cofactor-independent phosphoglycerate mutase [Planctomycetia bacterium]